MPNRAGSALGRSERALAHHVAAHRWMDEIPTWGEEHPPTARIPRVRRVTNPSRARGTLVHVNIIPTLSPDYVLRASHLRVGRGAILRTANFPFLPIEGRHLHRLDGTGVDATGVDADSVGMRARNIKRLYAAAGTEEMLGDMGIERVRRQRIAPGDELETIGGHDQMQEPVLAADGAIAVGDLDMSRGRDFEAYSTAMTSAGVCTHSCEG